MKVKGAELLQFMESGWPEPEEDWYWDHNLFESHPDPKTVYDTDEIGPIFFQGHGEDYTKGDGIDLAKAIRLWRKRKTMTVMIVDVPNEKIREFKAYMKAIKGKVLS